MLQPVLQSFQVKRELYAPLNAADRAGQIVRRLSDAVALGLLQPGDRLPAETDLAEAFEVAPATVREALARLRDARVIETRRGRNGGSFIVEAPIESAEQRAGRLHSYSTIDLRDLGDEWAMITTACVRLAQDRHDHTDIERLKHDVTRFENALSLSLRNQHYSRFWIDLAVTAQSARLLSHQMRIQFEIAALLWPEHRDTNDLNAAVNGMHDIITAIGHPHSPTETVVNEVIRRDSRFLIAEKLRIERASIRQKGIDR